MWEEDGSIQSQKYIVTCQVHPALVKRAKCTVRSSFLNFLAVITRLALSTQTEMEGLCSMDAV